MSAIDDTEEWRPVVGFPAYEVSSHGRVRSLIRLVGKYMKPGRILRPGRKMWKGRRLVALQVALGRGHPKKVHRLVLEAFRGPCPPEMEGCHNDGDPGNNRLSNLRWDTHDANRKDMEIHGTTVNPPKHFRGSNAHTWLNADDIACIRAEPYFPGVNQMLGKCFGVSYMTPYRIRRAA